MSSKERDLSAGGPPERDYVLDAALASIGDAVIVTDENGQIGFLNPTAEALTGWSSAEAKQRPLAQVFRIINERTRALAENPVEKVLQSGLVQGLANHTVLLAHDGREIPIDDSAAPIRTPDGRIRGIVLVFRDITERRGLGASKIMRDIRQRQGARAAPARGTSPQGRIPRNARA